MKLYLLPLCILTLECVTQAAPAPYNSQAAASGQIDAWQKQYNRYIEDTIKARSSGCTSENIVYRKEWGSVSPQTRKDYISAVKCLQKKAPLFPNSEVPGAQSRYDDFAATHILQANFVHFSGLFLHFHRYFIWLYEIALREECGYKGTQPYWDWTLSWEDPSKSTVFNGSPTSMGSNGQAIPHGYTHLAAFGITLDVPPGTGGGCLVSGPFSQGYNLSLGPIAFQPVDGDNGLDYNPRCLTRDLNPGWSNQTKPTDVVNLISGCNDLGCFDSVLEAISGVHAGGHFTIGGINNDALASAGDPAFYLHHAQVDRVWSIWQGLNAANRTNQVYGTGTAFNEPPSPNVTLATSLNFDVLSPSVSIRDVVSTIDGPFCYEYL